jgi:Zn-dependent protease
LPGIDFTQVLIEFLILLVSLTVHEAAHAWSADRLGDATARLLGRVSFNPAAHIDLIGTIVFPLIALTTGAPVFGWAKPVPVNVHNLGGGWKEKYMAIAAAGPASNLLLAIVAAALMRVLPFRPLQDMIYINVLLAVFNMIPVPPLDGGNVLSGLLRGPAADIFDRVRPYGFLILYGLLFSGVLWTIVTPPTSLILSWLL